MNGLQLELRPFGLAQRFFERKRLLRALRKHYGGEARRQVHKILLHTNIAGAAAGGITNVAGGIASKTSGMAQAAASKTSGIAQVAANKAVNALL